MPPWHTVGAVGIAQPNAQCVGKQVSKTCLGLAAEMERAGSENGRQCALARLVTGIGLRGGPRLDRLDRFLSYAFYFCLWLTTV